LIVIAVATTMSMSSAPILMLLMQGGLISVEAATRRLADRFLIIGGVAVSVAVAAHLASGGGIAGLVTRYLSLNPWTASYRQLVWTHVADDVWAHPLFGTGGSWTRLSWMGDSVDNFYYFKALSFGVPVVASLSAAICLIAWRLLRAGTGMDVPGRMRLAWLIAMTAIAFGGLTVDYHGRILPYVMMIAGLGAAMVRLQDAPAADR